ncbi:MAG TPA: ABC transporter substrate-binding protein [Jatrophihabitans sp.]|nr:ABC transporter substrate-binding protein [Jatrophihabitans sp.]
MQRTRKVAMAVGLTAAATMIISACGSSGGGSSNQPSGSSSNGSGGNQNLPAAFNAATIGFVNASNKTGGTLNLLASGDCDSWDPANTYYGWCWNMQRLFTRTLVGYSSIPGANNVAIEGDLATGLGEHNATFDQWTYHLKSIKWENGQPVTSQEIKYGIERVFATDLFSQGPASYYLCLLDKCDAKGNPSYQGPYKNKTGGLDSITTPDANTISFKLNTSTPDFDYLMALPASAPVPLAENGSFSGAKYTLHPLSDGPFKFDSYTPEQKVVWVRNSNWDQSTDKIRTPKVDKITLTINSNSDDNDKQLQAGTADFIADGGVQTAFQTAIATNPDLKKNADDPVSSYTRYFAVFPQTIPNIHCRRAIFYAMNKVDLQRARGGTYGGDIAHTMAQPTVPGHDNSADPYDSGPDNTGDLAKAKDELTQCGKPNGFTTKEAYVNSGRGPAVFAASQSALQRVGIKVLSAVHAQSGYYGGFIGKPDTVKSVGIGLAQAGWGADYPTGGGFWTSIAASYAPPGGGNYTQLNDPKVDGFLKEAAQSTGRHDDLFKQLDAQVMADAVMLPFLYDKTLYYRNPRDTNVRNNFALGSYYDAVNVGVNDGK